MDQTNNAFLFYGFAAAWLVVIGYVVLLALRERKLKKQLDQMQAMISSETANRKGK
ncbi:MAG: CcmD family protein [Bryobacteraceae bacterium]